jgi:hypothetical protein
MTITLRQTRNADGASVLQRADYLTHVPAGCTYAGFKFANPQPLPLDPNTANFSDKTDSIYLGELGVYYTDAKWHRDLREAHADFEARVKAAYEALGLDRVAEHRRIAGEITTHPGVWIHSTGEYITRCRELDEEIVAVVEKHQ